MKEKQRELDRKLADIEKKKEKIIADAREEARAMIREAKETAGEVQKELKELARMESMGARNRQFDKSRKKLREKEEKYAEKIVRKFNSNPVLSLIHI